MGKHSTVSKSPLNGGLEALILVLQTIDDTLGLYLTYENGFSCGWLPVSQ